MFFFYGVITFFYIIVFAQMLLKKYKLLDIFITVGCHSKLYKYYFLLQIITIILYSLHNCNKFIIK